MRTDVEDMLHQAVLHLVPEQLHTHRLHHPWGGRLEVVQKHLAGDVLIVQNMPVLPHILPRPGQDPVLEEGDRQTGGGDGPGQFCDAMQMGMLLAEGAFRRTEEDQGGGLQAQLPGAEPVSGKFDQLLPLLISIVFGGQIAHRVQQGEGGVRVPLLRVVEVAQQGSNEPWYVGGPGVGQHGGHHQLQGVADVAALLLGGFMVRVNDAVQVLLPEGERHLRSRVAGHVGGQLLAVDQVEAGDDLPDEGGGLTADVALSVDQQLIQEGEGLGLLPHRQIGKVLLEHIEICPQLLPVLGGAGGLDDIAELALVGQHMHQADAVAHRQQGQALHRLVRPHQGGVLVRSRWCGMTTQVHIHPQGAHIVLKVVELSIDKLVPAALDAVHIIQLGQNDLEGLVQGVEHGGLVPAGVPVLLGTEVGVDQAQGLHRQGLQFQIPGGVVGRDVADPLHPPFQQPLIGVVVVEIGYTLPGPASELPNVMGRRRPGDQGQVHIHPCLLEPTGRRHGDVVDPGDVSQGAEGGNLLPQAHQLIDVLPAEAGQKPLILPGAVAGRILLRRQKVKVRQRIEGQCPALLIQQHLEDREIKAGSTGVLLPVRGKVPLRVEDAADIAVTEGQPAVLRGRGQLGQDGGAQLQHLAALQPPPDGKQLGQLLRPARGAQQLQRRPLVRSKGQ